MLFRQLFDRETCTYTYLLADVQSGDAILIDPVREHFDRDRSLLEELNLKLALTIETHIHADHVTSGSLFRSTVGSKTAVSAAANTDCADVKIAHRDVIQFGRHHLEARATPGHTSTCMSYYSEETDRIFTGDTLFIRGCGRTDFQEGDSEQLYRSVHEQIFSLPEHTLIYPGHDYKGRTASSVREEKRFNPRLGAGKSMADFVAIMNGLNLSFPKRIKVAVPANMQCGYVASDTEALSPSSTDMWAPIVRKNGLACVSLGFLPQAKEHGMLILDVRSADEFAENHLEGAQNIPISELERRVHELDKQRSILCICKSGVRSARATAILERLGFQVASIEGGMLGVGAPSCG